MIVSGGSAPAMRFIGIFQHGRCYAVAATDAEAHAAVEAHPRLVRSSLERINARELARGTGTPMPQEPDADAFSSGHVRDVTEDVVACLSAMPDSAISRAAYVARQQEMARAALERDHLGASRAALRVLRVTDFVQPERAETLLAQLRDSRTAPDELRQAMKALSAMLTADDGDGR
jgi:hypothetical protein